MSRFVFPIFALFVSLYLVLEQYFGSYRASGSYYVYGLAAPVILFALTQLVEDVVGKDGVLRRDRGEDAGPMWDWNADHTRVAIFLAAAILCFLALPYLGYHLSFGLFLVTGFWLLNYRKPLTIGLLVIGTVLLIQFAFVQWLGTNLPKGLLKPWL